MQAVGIIWVAFEVDSVIDVIGDDVVLKVALLHSPHITGQKYLILSEVHRIGLNLEHSDGCWLQSRFSQRGPLNAI